MAKMPKKHITRIGITIAPANDVPSVLWSNGIAQNIVHLALLLKQLPNTRVFLLAYPFDKLPIHPIGASFDIPTINDHAAALTLDVIIELGIRIEHDFTAPFRDGGGKLVSYMAGNSMVMNFESLFLEGSAAARGSMLSPVGFDAIWITPQHWHMNAEASRMTGGPPFKAPHIWSPAAIEHASQSLGLNAAWKGRPETWSLGTFDPNINVVKSFHFPLLVAEAAFRQEPDAIKRMMLFCTEHLKGRGHFESFVGNISIGKAGKVTSEARHGIVSMLGREVDAVITHQWENGLNYLFWDTLYLGYPLIHNSPEIAEAGYWYESFNPQMGGKALIEAMAHHTGPSEADKQAVWRHHINNPANLDGYAKLIQKLLDGDQAGD